MQITSLIILTAGAFIKPGTALQIDAQSCARKSPWTEPEENSKSKNSLYLAYINMLNPAIHNVATMINTVIGQFHNMNPRVAHFAQYIFGNNANQGLQGSILHLQNTKE